VLQFLLWRLMPVRVASRIYLNRQLQYQGLSPGRLSAACVQDLADLGVDNAKVLAAMRRLQWRQIVPDSLDIVALSVWRLLTRPEDTDGGVLADKCYTILIDHGALPSQVP
jgi:hypothetical protein